jgi:transcriptional regulator with XRE-family HTH domain
VDIKDLLLEHFLAWQTREREKKTLKQFAEFVGMSPQQLNHYWTGKRAPTSEISDLFYGVFGDERFYTLAGYEVPDHRLQFLNKHWSEFDENDKTKIIELFNHYQTRTRKRNAATDIKTSPHPKPME